MKSLELKEKDTEFRLVFRLALPVLIAFVVIGMFVATIICLIFCRTAG